MTLKENLDSLIEEIGTLLVKNPEYFPPTGWYTLGFMVAVATTDQHIESIRKSLHYAEQDPETPRTGKVDPPSIQ